MKNYDTKTHDKGASKDFCFKCHRKEDAQTKSATVWAVNGFCFNKKYNTFASYGGDGTYTTWNKDTKSKYRSSEPFPEPIVAADQTEDGQLFAYGIGYDWQRGAEGMKEKAHTNQLFIRVPELAEVYKSPSQR